jgi:glycerol-3-phosphate dehydrogenase (NAD(P)+)
MNFVVIGAGAWGTAFAVHLARIGHPVSLVPRRAEHAGALLVARENVDYLPGVPLPDNLTITADLSLALLEADILLLACPSQSLRETCLRIRKASSDPVRFNLVLSLVKGLELQTHKRPSEVITEVFPGLAVGSLTGPTNAEGVAQRLPAAMLMALPQTDLDMKNVQ